MTRAEGFSYIEVLLAMILLAVCLVPAMDAVRNASAAPQVSLNGAAALACLKARMEEVAAEPYQNLLESYLSARPSYSLAKDVPCPFQRDVFISPYDPDGSPPFRSADTGLLYVSVSTPASDWASAMSLTTLVAR
jgi:type II secretory pathway pseudopilin PulG